MYDFFYNHLKYGSRCERIYTDTESLLLEIQTEDIYEDMAKGIHLYDPSNYPTEHQLYSGTNKSAWKDERRMRGAADQGSSRAAPQNVLGERSEKKISGKLRD